METDKGVPAFVVWGAVPEFEREGNRIVMAESGAIKTQAMEVFLSRDAADSFLVQGLMGAFAQHAIRLKPGGTISLFINRGVSDAASNGSFVINNPEEARSVWDFRVEERKAVRS